MEVSRSGRARKKSAKLLEMEETEVEFSSTTKAKKKSESDTALKKSPKATSPKKKTSLSSLLPHVASLMGGGAVEGHVITTPAVAFQPSTSHDEMAPLQIDLKTPKSSKKKTKRAIGDVIQEDTVDTNIEENVDLISPKAKKRKTAAKKSAKKTQEIPVPQPAIPQHIRQETALHYSFDDDDIKEEYDEDYDVGDEEDDDIDVKVDVADDVNRFDDVNYSSDETETEDEIQEAERKMVAQMILAEQQQHALAQQPALLNEPSTTKRKHKTTPRKSQAKPKKPLKTTKGKKGKAKETKGKRGRPRTTAYTLWCNDMRRSLMVQHPELAFADVSKKLSELWNTVSAADKQSLRRKAKAIQRKQDKGEDVHKKPRAASTHLKSGQSQIVRKSKPTATAREPNVPYTSQNYTYKVTGNNPIDVAAHLKLLGESLATIGARLQEHKGQIAVQGSLSVLLDSLLCALGPLMCLTNQVPELDAIAMETHKQTLDNLAYIMPGIG